MKHTQFIIAICLWALIYPLARSSSAQSAGQHVFVYKADGTRQCESEPEIELDNMAEELTSRGILVFSGQKGYDGREGVALCGSPTGMVNVYEIAFRDLAGAVRLGFTKLP